MPPLLKDDLRPSAEMRTEPWRRRRFCSVPATDDGGRQSKKKTLLSILETVATGAKGAENGAKAAKQRQRRDRRSGVVGLPPGGRGPNRASRPASSPVPAAITSATLSKGQANDVYVTTRSKLASSGYLKDDSFLVECVITVLLDNRPTQEAAAAANLAPPTGAAAPPSDLHRHFGELWRSQKGTDIAFLVSGEPIAALKCVLDARSPVFMAELFGDTREKASQRVEIEDMGPEVFRAMLHFIHTDTVPELDQLNGEEATVIAQHLLEAADRYGLERLKMICVEKMCTNIGVGTVATTLALAEQHGCPKLKSKCMEFILGGAENFQAVAATECYKHLKASCPLVFSNLLSWAFFFKVEP
ncbi:BTB/POZ and MATH domain-containing protein 1-like [Miscanthus floridulus]|uniref:BTB/POZ and MATH domain-containing protein 1-like n=1 Tax=Miscanthus floridulus TaxID=154761 RepID=UPI0034577AB0